MRCIARGPSSELRDKCDCADEEHSLETRATSFAATMNMSLCDTSRIGMPMIMEAGACCREEQQKKCVPIVPVRARLGPLATQRTEGVGSASRRASLEIRKRIDASGTGRTGQQHGRLPAHLASALRVRGGWRASNRKGGACFLTKGEGAQARRPERTRVNDFQELLQPARVLR